jgi:hypothetical protein
MTSEKLAAAMKTPIQRKKRLRRDCPESTMLIYFASLSIKG